MEMLDPATEKGKQFQAVVARESPDWEGWQSDSRPKTEPMKAELEKPYLVDIGREFKKCKKEGRPRWYSMFNGVYNLYEMAKEVNLERLYKMKHGPLSAVIHARDPDALLSLQDDGGAEFTDLRDSRGVEKARKQTCNLLMMGTEAMIRKFLACPNRQGDQGEA